MAVLRRRVFLQRILAVRPSDRPRQSSSHSLVKQHPALAYGAGHLANRPLLHHRLFPSSTPTTMANNMGNQGTTRPATVIRAASPSDATEIANLGVHVFSLTFGHSVEGHELQAYLDEFYSPEAIARDLRDPNRDTVVATDPAGDVLGFAMLTRGTSEPCLGHLDGLVELQRIYAYPKAHGTGAGKLLADRVEEMARDQGFKHIWLGVWEENHRAKKAYEKWGYRKCGTHDFAVGPVVQTDDIMVKRL
ncbi:acyl-CoA N-acyltransferase [Colletotrichum falcatum]|nr:acyl-CoA N-acyltransferase [Colletotrichum falcatum]